MTLKTFLKNILINILLWQARLVLRKYKPRIIAITGTVGKTSTKEAVYAALSPHVFVRKSEKSFNSELGIPLTILGCDNAWSDALGWMRNVLAGFSLILLPNHYPATLILEVGTDRPGDVKRIASFLHPDVVIFTRFSKTPVHVEFFESPEALFEEKKQIVKALKQDGFLLLNADDPKALELRESFAGKIVTFGFDEGADMRATRLRVSYEGEDGFPCGMRAEITCAGGTAPLLVSGTLGKQQVVAALAACATAVALGVTLVDAAGSFTEHHTPPGRMRLVSGIKGSLIIDDSYNSSPVAAHEALVTLESLNVSGKKIAVLGDMTELGAHTLDAHKEVGERAARAARVLLTVGIRARGIAEGALSAGMPEENILQLEHAREAGKELEKILEKGDIVLIKGSQVMRMERIVEEVMAEPSRAEELLVRQEREWKKKQ